MAIPEGDTENLMTHASVNAPTVGGRYTANSIIRRRHGKPDRSGGGPPGGGPYGGRGPLNGGGAAGFGCPAGDTGAGPGPAGGTTFIASA
ncbi:hypothetical protein GCM10023223_32440 [Stackebrandtia albiflava]